MKWKDIETGYTSRIANMAKMSPHELLGVEIDSPSDVIKSAYIRLIKTYHPDRSDPFMAKYHEEVIKLVNSAYEKLKETK